MVLVKFDSSVVLQYFGAFVNRLVSTYTVIICTFSLVFKFVVALPNLILCSSYYDFWVCPFLILFAETITRMIYTQSTIAPRARILTHTRTHDAAHTKTRAQPTHTHAHYEVVIHGDPEETPASLGVSAQEYVCVRVCVCMVVLFCCFILFFVCVVFFAVLFGFICPCAVWPRLCAAV